MNLGSNTEARSGRIGAGRGGEDMGGSLNSVLIVIGSHWRVLEG